MHSSESCWVGLPEFRHTPLRRLGDALIAPLARLGLAGKRTHVLTTVGRKTGRRHSTPVQLVFQDGARWLVSPYGERDWVKNVRAAGEVELTRALRTERARVEEVDPVTAAPILREYLRKTPLTMPYFDASAESPLEEFAAEASRHPVFRVRIDTSAN
jgi:deazaflavin-dependent oxidoreductase (nitroreductase family)